MVCDETETVLAEETRPGSSHCSDGATDFIRRILNLCYPLIGEMRLKFPLRRVWAYWHPDTAL